jgi:hypothetical protein
MQLVPHLHALTPWFGKPGMGTQYMIHNVDKIGRWDVQYLIEMGFIKGVVK